MLSFIPFFRKKTPRKTVLLNPVPEGKDLLDRVLDRKENFRHLKEDAIESILSQNAYSQKDIEKLPQVADKFEKSKGIGGSRIFYEKEYRQKTVDILKGDGSLKSKKRKIKKLMKQKRSRQQKVLDCLGEIAQDYFENTDGVIVAKKYSSMLKKGVKLDIKIIDSDKNKGAFGRIFKFAHESKNYVMKVFYDNPDVVPKHSISGNENEANALFYTNKYAKGLSAKTYTTDFKNKFYIAEYVPHSKGEVDQSAPPLDVLGLYWGDNSSANLRNGKIVDAGVMNRLSPATNDSKFRGWMIRFNNAKQAKRVQMLEKLPDNYDENKALAVLRVINSSDPSNDMVCAGTHSSYSKSHMNIAEAEQKELLKTALKKPAFEKALKVMLSDDEIDEQDFYRKLS